MARPKKETSEKKNRCWSQSPNNNSKAVTEKYLVPSPNYKDVTTINAADPVLKVHYIDDNVFRLGEKNADRERISLKDYAHLIYTWLLFNPKMLSISDYYDYPKDNAPFIYSLDEVIQFDSDEIYNLLQDRITKCMLRKQVDREAALAILKEKYGWARDNEQNINLNTNGKIAFKFGDSINVPTDNNNEENGKQNGKND